MRVDDPVHARDPELVHVLEHRSAANVDEQRASVARHHVHVARVAVSIHVFRKSIERHESGPPTRSRSAPTGRRARHQNVDVLAHHEREAVCDRNIRAIDDDAGERMRRAKLDAPFTHSRKAHTRVDDARPGDRHVAHLLAGGDLDATPWRDPSRHRNAPVERPVTCIPTTATRPPSTESSQSPRAPSTSVRDQKSPSSRISPRASGHPKTSRPHRRYGSESHHMNSVASPSRLAGKRGHRDDRLSDAARLRGNVTCWHAAQRAELEVVEADPHAHGRCTRRQKVGAENALERSPRRLEPRGQTPPAHLPRRIGPCPDRKRPRVAPRSRRRFMRLADRLIGRVSTLAPNSRRSSLVRASSTSPRSSSTTP